MCVFMNKFELCLRIIALLQNEIAKFSILDLMPGISCVHYVVTLPTCGCGYVYTSGRKRIYEKSIQLTIVAWSSQKSFVHQHSTSIVKLYGSAVSVYSCVDIEMRLSIAR